MKLGLTLALAAVLAVSAAPAEAQDRDPARSMRLGDEPSTPDDLRLLQRFSHCVAQRHPAEAATLLAMDHRSHDYSSAMRRIAMANSGCAVLGRAPYSAILFAGGMAETLLQQRNMLADLGARTAIDPARPVQARDENEVMSLCVVRAAPTDVAAMLGSGAVTPEETTAFRALMPRVGECLAAGVNLRLNRQALRAMLALSSYRLVQHNLAPPAAARN